jgi:Protein of unknown function (DUF1573)
LYGSKERIKFNPKLINEMRKLLVIAFLAALVVTSYAQQAPAKSAFATFTWDSSSHDFGKIKQGTPVTHEFKFTNTGKTPLIITNVQASCGCTTPSWTKEEVMPGGTGFIKATYNAAAVGAFNKTVTVTANIESGFVQLTIKGEVLAAGASQPQK